MSILTLRDVRIRFTMGQFKIIRKRDRDITFIVFSGKMVAQDFVDAMEAFYHSKITSKVVCIFSRCDVRSLSKEQLSFVAYKTVKFSPLRSSGKSAFVCRDDLSFGLGRMFTTLARLMDNPISSGVFRSTAKALAWLES